MDAPETVRALVARIATELAAGGRAESEWEAREIVTALREAPRSWAATAGDTVVDATFRARAMQATAALLRGMPIQYAVGTAAFRSLVLAVDPRVLIPRPETELLVDLVLRLAPAHGVAADIGTGSGCIALALATEGAFSQVIATDLSGDALRVAEGNLHRIPADRRARVRFRQGADLTPVAGERLTALVSNPPYIAHAEADGLPPLVRDWEPPTALFSDADGMGHITRLAAGSAACVVPGGLLALEVDSRRADEAATIIARDARWGTVTIHQDLTGRDRFVTALRQE
ncbi:MAG: peptide chain release factor N(5)-glutamine methyltransferase [Gemmatimonadaceae bacterium]|nr:peptide chain release factor N(5)-glutamine methyltransferase [Gemmatimonadaceae bacterium]